MWNIKKIISKGDYYYCVAEGHPKANKHGYVLHHRVVVENHLNRLLSDREVVHHINGDKRDNRIENLQVLDSKTHLQLHGAKKGRLYVDLKCPQCGRLFTKPHNSTHVVKGGLYTTCSRVCRGKLSRFIQLHGATHIVESAISENILTVYRKYAVDNPEET
jgi:uncharacterized C2H2 Zn-finger protein